MACGRGQRVGQAGCLVRRGHPELVRGGWSMASVAGEEATALELR
jgi:hypothetical protein